MNVGNYGINYTINLRIKKNNPTRICLTPLGGVYAGAMRVNYKDKTNLLLTPEGRTFFGEYTPAEPEFVRVAREVGLSWLTADTELAELGIYNGGKVSFEYTPPGASNLPAFLILIPQRFSQ